MYYDTLSLNQQLSKYASPRSKMSSMVRSGEYIRIRRGLYIKDNIYNEKTLANIIYGPSYISYEYALSYYGLIPERAETVTSAVYNKNKNKIYKTPAGIFEYRYINPNVYSRGIMRIEEDEPFLIASKEKALCDTLYKIKKAVDNIKIEELLLDDLRIYEEELLSLNHKFISSISGLYNKVLIRDLSKYLIKRKTNA